MSDEDKKEVEKTDETPETEAPQTWAEPEGSIAADSEVKPVESTEEPAPEADKVEDPAPEADKAEDPAEGESKSRQVSAKAKKAAAKAAGLARATGAKAGAGAKAVWADPLVCVRKLDGVIDWVRETFPSHLFSWFADWLTKLGHVSMITAAVIGIIFCIIASVKLVSLVPLVYGLCFVLMLFIAQYSADKFLGAGDSLISSSPSVLTSPAFLQCVALISEIVGLVSFFWFLYLAFNLRTLNLFWIGLGIAIVCDTITFIAVHPALVNTEVSETASAGEEALGIISFFMKTLMRLVPVVFGTGAVLGTFALLAKTLGLLVGRIQAETTLDMMDIAAGPVLIIAYAALLPFAAYILYTVYCLVVEVIRALLSLGTRD